MQANEIESIQTPVSGGISIVQRVWFHTREEAEEQVMFYDRMLNTLAKSCRVFVRRLPEWYRGASFDIDKVEYRVFVCFVILEGTPELYKPSRVYDNEMPLSGFGLAPEIREGTTVCSFCRFPPKKCICHGS